MLGQEMAQKLLKFLIGKFQKYLILEQLGFSLVGFRSSFGAKTASLTTPLEATFGPILANFWAPNSAKLTSFFLFNNNENGMLGQQMGSIRFAHRAHLLAQLTHQIQFHVPISGTNCYK